MEDQLYFGPIDNQDVKTPAEKIAEVKELYRKVVDENNAIIRQEFDKIEGALISDKEAKALKLEVLNMIDSISLELVSLRAHIMK